MAGYPVCVHCGCVEASHANDGGDDVLQPYVPLPGAMLSLLDCPGFVADSDPDLETEEL